MAKRRGGRAPVKRGDAEQGHGVRLLLLLGAKVYVSGTRRPGTRCPKCGEFVLGHQGTCQTAGIPDVEAWMPALAAPLRRLLKWECKAGAGRLSPDQEDYRALCQAAGVDHVAGDCNALITWLIGHGYLRRDQVPHYRVDSPAEPRTPRRKAS